MSVDLLINCTTVLMRAGKRLYVGDADNTEQNFEHKSGKGEIKMGYAFISYR